MNFFAENYGFGGSKPRPTNKSNPCPVCDNTSGKCRTFADRPIVLCGNYHSGESGGYRFVKPSNNLWSVFVPIDDRLGGGDWKDSLEARERRNKLAIVAPVPRKPVSQRDREYRSEPAVLSVTRRENLRGRGITDSEIDFGLGRHWLWNTPKGFAIAAMSLGDQIQGCQIANDDRSKAKYIWDSKDGSGQLPGSGEMPIAYFEHPNCDRSKPIKIIACDAFLKSFLAATKGWRSGDYQTVFVGAPGGNFQPIQLKNLLDTLKPVSVAYAPDGGDVGNSGMMRAIAKFVRNCKKNGIEPSILWWNQYSKEAKDLDELTQPELQAAERLDDRQWRIIRRLGGKLNGTRAGLKLKTADLEKIDISDIPRDGILAISSGKGTGKTKLLAKLISDEPKVVSIGHRISLQRNLSYRLALAYIRDLEKQVRKYGRGAGKVARVGSVIDSILKHNLEDFEDGVLVIDEAKQLARHLMSSDTCAKDGKRPVLLARLAHAVRVCRQLILSDADLDDATIEYFAKLRGDGQQPFLIRNDADLAGYPVTFINCQNRSAVVSDLMANALFLPKDKTIYVACDSNGETLAGLFPNLRVLLVNSKTSGGEAQQEFIKSPDRVLARHEYDIIIGSPSIATGVSIEIQGVIDSVYGIFTGNSLDDADMSQALSRVREKVRRVVWCAERGANFSKISSSTNPLEIKRALAESTSATVSLIRSGLRADAIATVNDYDWSADPHINLFAKLEAERNASMWDLRLSLLERLQHEGNQIHVVEMDECEDTKGELRLVRQIQKEKRANDIVAADIVNFSAVASIESKESASPEEQLAVDRFMVCDFYQIKPHDLTVVEVLADEDGARRRRILALEAQLDPEAATARSINSIIRQVDHGQGLSPWDISTAKLKQELRSELGLDFFLRPGATWHKHSPELKELAAAARAKHKRIKAVLGVKISLKTDKNGRYLMTDCQILGVLLNQLDIKTARDWGRENGERLRIYRVEEVRFAELTDILSRRQKLREEIKAAAVESAEVADCVSMIRSAIETDDDQAIADTIQILQEALKESPEAKREVWARLSIENQERLRGAAA